MPVQRLRLSVLRACRSSTAEILRIFWRIDEQA
jgi:hypothetical protein